MSKRHAPQQELQRRTSFRRPPRVIYIVCEGELTEPTYFNGLATFVGNQLVRIRYEAGVGVPITVVDRALALRDSLRASKDSFTRSDTVWAVFDRDLHPSFPAAVAKARANSLLFAYSNPCFEVWLLMHFEDFDAPLDHIQVQRRLRQFAPGYDRRRSKTVDFSLLSAGLAEAEKRATRVLRRRDAEGDARGRPSTNVHELAAAIRRAGRRRGT